MAAVKRRRAAAAPAHAANDDRQQPGEARGAELAEDMAAADAGYNARVNPDREQRVEQQKRDAAARLAELGKAVKIADPIESWRVLFGQPWRHLFGLNVAAVTRVGTRAAAALRRHYGGQDSPLVCSWAKAAADASRALVPLLTDDAARQAAVQLARALEHDKHAKFGALVDLVDEHVDIKQSIAKVQNGPDTGEQASQFRIMARLSQLRASDPERKQPAPPDVIQFCEQSDVCRAVAKALANGARMRNQIAAQVRSRTNLPSSDNWIGEHLSAMWYAHLVEHHGKTWKLNESGRTTWG